jgi:hypothetical protein
LGQSAENQKNSFHSDEKDISFERDITIYFVCWHSLAGKPFGIGLKMIRGGKVAVVTAFLTLCLQGYSCSANQSMKTYVSESGWKSLELPRPSGTLFVQELEDTVKVHTSDSPKLKNPKVALIYAIFPGIIIHGAGHFYAGADSMAWFLMTMEGIGIGIWSLVLAIYCIDGTDLRGLALPLSIGGGYFFVLSWFYDMFEAPHAVEEHNQRIFENRNTSLEFNLDQKDNYMGFRIVKRF